MEGVCHNGFSHLLQGGGYGRYMSQGNFTSVKRRGTWKAFAITEFHKRRVEGF